VRAGESGSGILLPWMPEVKTRSGDVISAFHFDFMEGVS